MSSILRRIGVRLRLSLFPNQTDREVMRWITDGGDEHARQEYDLNSESLILDLGGYKGQWASDVYARYNCRVLVFEPIRSFAAGIQKRFTRNPRIEVFCLALGEARREDTIGLSENGSSVYRDAPVREIIQFEDVAQFFIEHDIDTVDLMKINIEGGEYELLPKLIEVGLIGKIKHFQIQFHDIAPDSAVRMDQICRELAKTHDPTYRYRFVWEGWTRREADA